MNLMKRRLAGAVLSLLAMSFAPAALAQQDNLVESIKQRGKLMVGFSSFVPWAMRDKQGQWVGFEIDVATKLAKDMGVQIELVPTAWDGIIPALISGKFDVIIGGMSVTPQRQQQIDFTDGYANSGQGVAASKKIASNLKWPDGYNSANVTFTCRRHPVQADRGALSQGHLAPVRR